MRIIIIIVFVLSFTACIEQYTPKPNAYPRILYPAKSYKTYTDEHCPFSFRYPQYCTLIPESNFFDQKAENPCWLNIDYANFKQRIHISYKVIDENHDLATLESEALQLTNKHLIKASSIGGVKFKNNFGAEGIIYDVGGNAASNIQFYITDREHHFVRGALYFYTQANADSLQPLIQFARTDLDTLLQSFKWK